jgi:hypothetical protein
VAFSPDGRAHTLGGPSDALAARALAVVVLDPSRGLYRVGETIPVRGDAFAEWGPGAERVTILDRQDRRPSLSLHDGTTGARLATLAADGTADSVSSTFLADGRVAVVEVHHAVRLRVFTRDGSESLSLEIAPRLAFVRPVEVAPGIVAVEIRNLEAFDTWTSVLVDVDHARVLRTERGLRPAPSSWYARVSGTTLVPSRLFIDDAGALVRLDLAKGARAKLLGG